MITKILNWCELNKVTYIQEEENGFLYISSFGTMEFMPFDDMK